MENDSVRVFCLVVVDDDRRDLDLLKESLLSASAPVELIAFTDGLSALNFLQSARRVDLIICDLLMPMISGINLLHAVLEDPRLSDIPFALTSGSRAKTQSAGLRERLEVPYFDKPFSWKGYQRLAQEIQAALRAPQSAAKVLAQRMMIG